MLKNTDYAQTRICGSFMAMITYDEAASLVGKYLAVFENEAERQKEILHWLERNKTNSLTSRQNFDGHITTSAFVVDERSMEMLLLEHKTLKKWFQPGGHVEHDASLMESALREALEETGIPAAELRYVAVGNDDSFPIDIDSHFIPENKKRGEPGHYHHDMRYLFVYSGSRDNVYDDAESTGIKWLSLAELAASDAFGLPASKIISLLAERAAI